MNDVEVVVEGDNELLTLALILDVVLPLPDSLGLVLTLLDIEAHMVCPGEIVYPIEALLVDVTIDVIDKVFV